MSQPVHTPGPAQLPSGFESVKPSRHEGLPLFADGDPFSAIAFVIPRKECNANARLLAAAYNAFDSAAKRLNCNAVLLAERMQDGNLLTELLTALCLGDLIPDLSAYKPVIEFLRRTSTDLGAKP